MPKSDRNNASSKCPYAVFPCILFFILVVAIACGFFVCPTMAEAIDGSNEEANAPSEQDSHVDQVFPVESTQDETPAGDAQLRVLSQDVRMANGATYAVSVTFGEEASIPEGAELVLHELEANDEDEEILNDVLSVQESDHVFKNVFFSATITRDNEVIQPSAPVTVEIRTVDVPATSSDTVEAALLDGDTSQKLFVRNLTGDSNQGEPTLPLVTRLQMDTKSLGMFGLAMVAEPKFNWNTRGESITVWGARSLEATPSEQQCDEELADDVRLVQAFAVHTNATHAWAPMLWITATDDTQSDVYELGGYGCIKVASNSSTSWVFGTEGTEQLTELPSSDVYALVWKDGISATDGQSYKVSIHGDSYSGLSRDTEVKTNEVKKQDNAYETYLSQSAELVGVPAENVPYAKVVDIALVDGATKEECEPQGSVHVRVNMLDADFPEGTKMHVVHFGETPEELDAATEGSTVEFATDGFSVYVVMAESAAQASEARVTTEGSQVTTEASTAKTFTLQSNVTGTSYWGKTEVHYIDHQYKELQGTVTGDQTYPYATQFDLYQYANALDPSIADDYEFSRVYLGLKNMEKDIRYIHLNTDKFGSSSSSYRIYFNMRSLDENKSGGEYYGTWYTFGSGTKWSDDVYIVYNHVKELSFKKVDKNGSPVQGATFALYTDNLCQIPYEYNGEVKVATSDISGTVSFGKVPYNTYYMKETSAPEGLKISGKVHTVTVDNNMQIDDIVDEDDDGSAIISGVGSMTIKKVWEGTDSHDNDQVTVTLSVDDEEKESVTLNKNNNWTDSSLTDLDPTVTYTVTEKTITSSGADVTSQWMPKITFTNTDQTTVGYYKTNQFIEGRTYVLVYNNDRALKSSKVWRNNWSLDSEHPVMTNENNAITSTVDDYMKWTLEDVTDDGVIKLKNKAGSRYLNLSSDTWNLLPNEPKFVRYKKNSDGTIRMFYRENLNGAASRYLKATNASTTDEGLATDFTIYQEVEIKAVTTTVTNNIPRYPLRIKKVSYQDSSLPVAGARFSLYKSDANKTKGDPINESLQSGTDGVLYENNALHAGYYYLEETGVPDDYAMLKAPIVFEISRAGRLSVLSSEFGSYDFVSTVTENETDYRVLSIPNKSGVEVGFKKIDGFGNALAGAEFKAYAEYECTNEVELLINDEAVESVSSTDAFDENTGYNVSFTIALGTHYLKETAPPAGYDQNAYVYRLTVKGENDFTIQRMSNAETIDEVPDIASYGMLNISSTKRTATLKKTKQDAHASLAGAVFEVLRYDRTKVEGTDGNGAMTTSFTSGSNGIFLVQRLGEGTYYLHETTVPEGYEKLASNDNWYTLTVSADGITVSERLSASP